LGVGSRLTGTPLSIKRQDLLLDYNDRNDCRGCIKTIEPVPVAEGGNYLKGEFVQDKEITEVVIDGRAEVVEKTFTDKATGKEETKQLVEVDVVCNNDDKSRVLWTMNATSRNMMCEILGTDETKWIGKEIPIIVDTSNKNAIFPNRVVFKKRYAKKQETL